MIVQKRPNGYLRPNWKTIYMCTRTHMFMPTKTITITEEAYNRLANEKADGESFTEVIKRISARGKLSDCFGKWEGDQKELTEIQMVMKKAWKDSRFEDVEL